MRFLDGSKFKFMSFYKSGLIIAIAMILLAISTIAVKGINLGLDFTGGTELEVAFKHTPNIEKIKSILINNEIVGAKVISYGTQNNLLISLPNKKNIDNNTYVAKIIEVLGSYSDKFDLVKQDYVGSEVGMELADTGTLAVIAAILVTMIYIALRFEFRFAISAALALLHDALIILGIFALFQVEFDLSTLAAILAIIGYSLNDTIVVFDRIRENFAKKISLPIADILDLSINQTLTRTIMTSVLTLLVVVALLVYAGSSLFSFSLTLCIGIIVGTYSSIFIASSLALFFGISNLKPEKEEVETLP